jgi:hypothetical protein
MGGKVIVVAVIASLFFGKDLSAIGWLAVIIAGLSVILLGVSPGGVAGRKKVLVAIGWAGVSLLFFSTSDNLVSAWSPRFGQPAFVAVVFTFVALFSFGLIPFFNEPLRKITRKAWPWVAVGSLILGLQALLLGVSLTYQDATVVNTLYSTRGLWAVLLVGLVGSLFGNREGSLPRWMLVSRFGGSVLILLSVYLLFFASGLR